MHFVGNNSHIVRSDLIAEHNEGFGVGNIVSDLQNAENCKPFSLCPLCIPYSIVFIYILTS